jgi:hypothetical protein
VAKAKTSVGSPAEVEIDMFGHVVEPLRERRGRPSYAKTPENQRFVETRAADGWTTEMIAADMGIHPDTLRKHFSVELQNGALKLKGEMLDILRTRARSGHTPSVNALLNRMDRVIDKPGRTPKAPPAERPLGKKEAKIRDAARTPEGYGEIFARLNKAN